MAALPGQLGLIYYPPSGSLISLTAKNTPLPQISNDTFTLALAKVHCFGKLPCVNFRMAKDVVEKQILTTPGSITDIITDITDISGDITDIRCLGICRIVVVFFDELHLEGEPYLFPAQFNMGIFFHFFGYQFKSVAPLVNDSQSLEHGSDYFVPGIRLAAFHGRIVNRRR